VQTLGGKRTPREGAGSLPDLLLDQGSLPALLSLVVLRVRGSCHGGLINSRLHRYLTGGADEPPLWKEITLMRRIVLAFTVPALLAVMVVAATAAFAQPPTIEKYKLESPVSDIQNPCPESPFYGENIPLEGVIHQVIQTTRVENETSIVYKYTNRIHSTNVTGTGEVSGDVYRVITTGGETGGSFLVSNSDPTSPEGIAGTDTSEIHYVVVSEGASPNFVVHQLIKYTFFYDGTVTAEVQNAWATCTGSG
jgi:hypothetical protein